MNTRTDSLNRLSNTELYKVFQFLSPKENLNIRPTNKIVNQVAKKAITQKLDNHVESAFKEWLKPFQFLYLLQHGNGETIKGVARGVTNFTIQPDGELFLWHASQGRNGNVNNPSHIHLQKNGIPVLSNPAFITKTVPIDERVETTGTEDSEYALIHRLNSGEITPSDVIGDRNSRTLNFDKTVTLENGNRRRIKQTFVRNETFPHGTFQILLNDLDNNTTIRTFINSDNIKMMCADSRYLVIKGINIHIYDLSDGQELGTIPIDTPIAHFSISDNKLHLIKIPCIQRIFANIEYINSRDNPNIDLNDWQKRTRYESYSLTPPPKFQIQLTHSIPLAIGPNGATISNEKTVDIDGTFFHWDQHSLVEVPRNGEYCWRRLPNDISTNKEIKNLDLRRFGDVKKIARNEDDVLILNKAGDLFKIHVGDPEPVPEAQEIRPLLFSQATKYAFRKWVYFSYANAIWETVAHTFRFPRFLNVVKGIAKLALLVIGTPWFIMHDALLALRFFGRLISRQDPRIMGLGLLGGIINFDRNEEFTEQQIQNLKDAECFHTCPLSGKIITHPAKMPGDDVTIYEESALDDYIFTYGINPKSRRYTSVAAIIPDNRLRQKILSAR